MTATQNIEHTPKFRQIASDISRSIRRGDFPAGTRLPDDETLGAQFNVSRNTLIRALCELRDTGLLKRIPGGGTFVNEQQEMCQATSLFFVYEGNLRNAGFNREGSIFSIGSQLTEHLREAYDLPLDQIFLGGTPPSTKALEKLEQAIQSKLSGVFLLPQEGASQHTEQTHRLLGRLREAHLAVVMLDHDCEIPPCRSGFDLVSLDNKAAGFEIGKHLCEQGTKRILFLKPPYQVASIEGRLEGLRAATRRHAQEHGQSIDLSIGNVRPENQDEIQRLIHEQQPDAIVGKDDQYAAAAFRALFSMHMRVPDDVLLAGFDDATIASQLPIPLSTVRQPIRHMAEMAAFLMFNRLQTPKAPPREIVVSGQLITRQSTMRNV